MTATFDPTDDTWRHVLTRDDWPDLLSAAVRRAALTLPTAVPFEIDDIARTRGKCDDIDIRIAAEVESRRVCGIDLKGQSRRSFGAYGIRHEHTLLATSIGGRN